jgi:DNA-directed RNA polymerase specialized sigma24 family protein
MEIADEDILYVQVEGVRYPFLRDEDMYRYFHGGVSIEQVARARGCSVSRAKALLKRQEQTYQMQAFYQRLEQQEKFDKTLAKLDPAGNSAMTMAYLQPLRGFLQAVAHDK